MTDIEQRLTRLETMAEERFKSLDRALQLQATEYERRLDALNHAHEQAVEVQHTYVTAEKYEDKLAAEEQARVQALERVDEKFDDYVKRWEQERRDLEARIAQQEEQAKASAQAAQIAARVSKEAVEHQARKTNRNLVIASLVLTFVIGLSNYLGSGLIHG